ncbi:hypothetical protein KY290_021646 [Solanum tuberosum]|uniref:Uncharacterized protein n=1 Tax=Solanum tuberosum TaxID=4113 RepID=A0ABQ7V470_SOLTU|nr:hypothetical protein KY290_021646 [Solanum tuberosum]
MPNYLPNCLGSKLGLKSDQMDPNSFAQPGSHLSQPRDIVSGKLQAVGGLMVMDMSSSGLLHSWSSSRFLDEVSPLLHKVSTDVSGHNLEQLVYLVKSPSPWNVSPSSSYGCHYTTLYDKATGITSAIGSHSKVETTSSSARVKK